MLARQLLRTGRRPHLALPRTHRLAASTFPVDAIPPSLKPSSSDRLASPPAEPHRLTGYLFFDSIFPLKLGWVPTAVRSTWRY